jgi:hypothetical protein
MPYAPFLPKPPPQPAKKVAPPPSGLSQLSFNYPYKPDGLIPETPEEALPTSWDDFPYYNEVVQRQPAIARKIRKNAPLDPYHIFSEQQREQHQLPKPYTPSAYGVNYATTNIDNALYRSNDLYHSPYGPYRTEQHLPTMVEPQLAYRNSGNYNNSLLYSGVGMVKEQYKPSDEHYRNIGSLERELFLHKIMIVILLVIVLLLIIVKCGETSHK